MTKYNFLLKPVFFIFCLLFATWLVVKIEEIRPSDFGKYESYVSQKPNNPEKFKGSKQYLKNVCLAYKNEVIDSVEFDQQLTIFLKSFENASKK